MPKRKQPTASQLEETSVIKRLKFNPHIDGLGPSLDGNWVSQIMDTKPDINNIKIASWNVNGLRAVLKSKKNAFDDLSDLEAYVQVENPDILCLNETKISTEFESTIQNRFPNHKFYFAHSEKKGYAGVGIMLRLISSAVAELEAVFTGIGDPELDTEGRSITLVYQKLILVASYVANAGQGLKRLDYRVQKFDTTMQKYLSHLRSKYDKELIWCGDLNVAYEEIDIWNSRSNLKSAGHTPEERASFGRLLANGEWHDVWRKQNPDSRRYTYWSARFPKNRVDNLGWRLDYFIASGNLLPQLGPCHIRDLVQVGKCHFFYDPRCGHPSDCRAQTIAQSRCTYRSP